MPLAGRWLLGAPGGRPRWWLGEQGFAHSGSTSPLVLIGSPEPAGISGSIPQMRFREGKQLAGVTQQLSDGLISPQPTWHHIQLSSHSFCLSPGATVTCSFGEVLSAKSPACSSSHPPKSRRGLWASPPPPPGLSQVGLLPPGLPRVGVGRGVSAQGLGVSVAEESGLV